MSSGRCSIPSSPPNPSKDRALDFGCRDRSFSGTRVRFAFAPQSARAGAEPSSKSFCPSREPTLPKSPTSGSELGVLLERFQDRFTHRYNVCHFLFPCSEGGL